MSTRTIITIVVVALVVLLILWMISRKPNGERQVQGPLVSSCLNSFCGPAAWNFSNWFQATTPVQVIYTLTYPGVVDSRKIPNIASYVNAQITGGTTGNGLITAANPSGIYNCWCGDVYDTINTGQSYTCNAVSMLATGAAAAFQASYTCESAHTLYTTYLAGILYLMNQAQSYEAQGYTYIDIQTAIWTLLYSATPTTATPINDSLTYTAANVAAMITAAIAAQTAYNASGNACTSILTNAIGGLMTLHNSPITSATGCDQVMFIACPLYVMESCC
jgi:hypothetical protein